MDQGIHFISGLPRSGSTLLAAILKQNAALTAGMSSPVGSLVSALQRQMSQENEGAVFIDDDKRIAVLRGLFVSYYHRDHPVRTVFDTNRIWCAKLPLIAALFPTARIIACVRHVPWILDSIERLVRANHLEPSALFNFDPSGTVYSRAESLGAGTGLIGHAWNALREAFHGEQSDRLMLLRYETMVNNPRKAIEAVYDFTGIAPFGHDFENITFDASAFDARLGMRGLHDVGRTVRRPERETILPPDVFRRVEADSFWIDTANNLRGVRIV